MAAMLPEHPSLSVTQSPGKLTRAKLEALDYLLIVIPPDFKARQWRSLPHGAMLQKLLRRVGSRKAVPNVATRLPNKSQSGVSVTRLAGGCSAFARLTTARKLVADALRHNPARIGVIAAGYPPGQARLVAEAVVAAVHAACFALPEFKSEPSPRQRLRTVVLHGFGERLDLARTQAEAAGNDLARWLTALPPNHLHPAAYRERVAALASESGWKMRFLDEKALDQLGAGAFLAVAQGSATRDAGIIHLRYRPAGSRKRPLLGLVGKGVCFDTGGTNLKPFKGMLDMHEDMQGSAVALGTLLALTRLAVDLPVDCWLAITENRIGPRAYNSRDVVTAANGTSIEVIHTDAEGRLALADTLALAARKDPALLIDYATLTGTCVVSLTHRYSGVFTNRPEFQEMAVRAGRESGERTWPFPMDDDYDEALCSQVADIMQCAVNSDGDHIMAARFLSRFVPRTIPWLHVDMAASHHKGGLAHIPTAITGFGVRYTLNLLFDQGLLANLAANDRPG